MKTLFIKINFLTQLGRTMSGLG